MARLEGMITLAIETSTTQGSVALMDGDAPLFAESFPAGRNLSSELFAVLERALKEAPPLGRIVVGLGPGSYAGVRIAISAAIGLGLATGAALLGIPSIAALEDAGDYIALGDARRESYYFAVVRNGECAEGPELVAAENLPQKLASANAMRSANPLPLVVSEPLAIAPQAAVRSPCAQRLAKLAAAGKSIVARDFLEPIYLRDPYITVAKK